MAGVDSGIKLDKDCVDAYETVKERKSNVNFCILKLSDDFRTVVLDYLAEPGEKFDDLVARVPKDHLRYIIFKCDYVTKTENQDRQKILLVTWVSDDDAPRKEKMVGASTAGTVTRGCPKIAKSTTINDWSDFTEENFINIVSDNRTK